MRETLTRDQAREIYRSSGLHDFIPLTHERMRNLRDTINREMLDAALMDGTFHMEHPATIKVRGSRAAELRCRSYYFDDREAVTFNDSGFVGFAGWADDFNVEPILSGFCRWVHFLLATSAAQREGGE